MGLVREQARAVSSQDLRGCSGFGGTGSCRVAADAPSAVGERVGTNHQNRERTGTWDMMGHGWGDGDGAKAGKPLSP